MSYFIIDKNLESGATAVIAGDEARHIAGARRSKAGDRVAVQGPNEVRLDAEVLKVSPKELTIKALRVLPTPPEPKLQIVLFQALIAEQALDVILQKATELGVSKLVLFPAEHSPRLHNQDKKLERWQRICLEAAKQSDRVRPAGVHVLGSIDEAVSYAEGLQFSLFLDPESIASISAVDVPATLDHVGIFIGPEGGWSSDEQMMFKAKENFVSVAIGPRILRAETAAIGAMAIVQGLWGDLK